MTQNKSGVSTLLLRYQVAGQDQLLKANTDVSLSLKEAEKAASKLGISIERLQELGSARIDAIDIGEKPLAAAKELEKTQQSRVAAVGEALKTESKITAELKAQEASIQRQSRGIRDIGMQRIPDPSLGDFGLNDGSPGRSLGQNITRFGRGLFNAPDVGGSTTIARASIAGGAVVDKLGLSVTQLGVAAGVAAPLTIAAAIALDRIGESAAAGQRRLAAALTAQSNYYDAIANLSTQAVQERLEGLRRERDAQQRALENSRSALEENFQALQSRIGGEVTFVGDALARVFDNQVGIGTLREATQQAEQQLNATNDEITRLEQGLENNAFAANDATAAIDAHTEALRRSREEFEADLRRSTNAEADTRVRLAGIRRSGSSSQIQDELAANADREAILRNFLIPSIEDLGLSAEETQQRTKEYRDELNRLLATDELLLNNVLPVVQAREAETKALQDQLAIVQNSIQYHAELAAQIRTSTVEQVADRLNAIRDEQNALQQYLPQLQELAPRSQEAAKALEDAQNSLGRLSDDFSDQITRVLPAALSRARAELSTDLAKLETERNNKFAEIEANRLEKEADAAEKRNDAYANAEEKRGEALNELAEKQNEQRLRIEKKSNAEITNAIFARDALAAYLAIQNRKEQLDDLKKDGEKRQGEVEKQYAKERQQADRNYERALRDAQQAADKARAAARRQYDIEYNERVTAYNQQLALLRDFVAKANTELANLRVPSLSAGLTSGQSGGTSFPPLSASLPSSGYGVPPMNPQVGDTWTDAFGQLRIWNGHGWQAASAVRGYASGTPYVPSTGLAMLHQGERVLTAQQNRVFSSAPIERVFGGGGGGGAGLNISIPIYGTQLTKRDIMDYAAEELSQTLDEAGWDD